MPTFAYTARDSAGAAASGTLIADSLQDVHRMLRADGKYPTGVQLASEAAGPTGSVGARGIKISRADLIQISTQLSIMVETGVQITEALECIATQAEKPNVARLAADLNRQVQSGSDLSSALARHPRSFPRLFVALIAASEKSGMLSRLLNRATEYVRSEADTIRRVRGALTYPAIMLGFAMTTTIFLLTFVLPKFTAIYASKGAALPAPTRILMAVSSFVITQYPWLIAGALLLAAGIYALLRTEPGRRVFDQLQLRVPLLGSMFRKLHLARGLRMIGTMAGAGVNLIDCVQAAHDLCPNSLYRDLWDEAREQIETGRQLSEPMLKSPLVPRSIAQMIRVGEKSGRLGSVMEQVAGYAEIELTERIAELTRYIEPIMISVMGLIIGSVAMALMLPIFTISKVIAR